MAEQFAVAAVPKLYEGAKWPIKWLYRKYDYWKNPETYHAIMMEEAKVLYKRRKDVAAEANRDPRMQPSEACRYWIRMVDEIREKVEKLETNYGKLNLPGTVSCFTLSKSMKQMAKELHDLWVKGEIFETRTAVERPPERVRHIHAPKTVDKPSLHRFVENIIDCLNDGKVKRIGLLGKAGIGKTTIMQNLNNHEKIAKMFHYVIWVTVPKDPSIEMLQQVIAQRLKLNLEGITGSDEIAHMISEKLKGSRYLLLLDEFRKFPNGEFLNLNALGINDNQMKSKVVFATRDRDNYFGMEINVQIKVEELSCADAWKMFQEIVGPIINRPGIKPIARKVLKECARIPLLIDRVARTFREMDDYHLWSEGLDRLRTKPKKFEGMEEVFEFLSICYNRLEEDRKICFLYSALYPEDCQIYKYYLLECWRAEGFTHADQGHSVLDDLIKVSLLERSEKMKHIRMNKVLRDMALRISLQRKGSKFLVRDVHEKSEQPPDEKEWVQANRISLVDDKLRRLPEAPGCNNLLTLLLQKNSDLTVIPKQFFQYMQSLRVLDLHGIGITSLPSCLSSLRRLRALYLNSCKHLNVLPPTIQALEDLEVLDIRGTGIKKLPCEMVKLIALRCLRISSSSFGGDTLVNRVISRLLWLEELSIDVDSYEQWWDMIGKAVTEEVATLTKLTSLSFCFPKVDCLEIFIARNPSWKTNCLTEDNRFKFQFCVGYHDSPQYAILDYFEYEIDKCLKVVKGEGVNVAISVVLEQSYAFELVDHKGVSKLSDFGIESMNQMRGCLIKRCDEIETIIDGNTITTGVLKFLEKMYIENASNLERIWEGPVHFESLVLLTTLTLQKCPKLKKLFSNGMIQQLSELQHLTLEECSEIEEIIMESENIGLDSNALPRLRTLVLLGLQNLKSIWVNDSLKWPSLEIVKILNCDSLMKLPFNNDNATKLGSIECEESWWNNIQQNVAIKQRVSEQKVLCSNPHVVLLLHIKPPTKIYSDSTEDGATSK